MKIHHMGALKSASWRGVNDPKRIAPITIRIRPVSPCSYSTGISHMGVNRILANNVGALYTEGQIEYLKTGPGKVAFQSNPAGMSAR